MYFKLKDILIERKNADKPAIKYGCKEIKYCELYDEVCRHSNIIRKHENISNNIGVFLPNSIDYVIAYFSITFAEGVIVPVDVKSTGTEIKSMLEYCEINTIITNSKYKDILDELLRDIGQNIYIYNLDDERFYKNEQAYLECCRYVHKFECDKENIALMIHTSGSMSNPKRVMLTHENLLTNTRSIIESLKLTSEDKTFISIPMWLASANTSQMLTHLCLGASIVINDSIFNPKLFFKAVEKEKITNFTMVPSIISLILESNSQFDISSLRTICFGGGPTPITKIEQIIKKYPSVNFVHMYGQTEATTRITHLLPEYSQSKMGSVGKPIPGVKLKILDKTGKQITDGKIGEVVVNGGNVMKGYYKRKDETVKVIKDGWLYTGDLGWLDEDGFLYIAGREKNIINFSGINIYPEEIEEVLLSHPAIKEARVYGEKHEEYGEVPVAQVVLYTNDIAVSEKDIIDFCVKHINMYKVPVRIDYISSINKTATGKIKREGTTYAEKNL